MSYYEDQEECWYANDCKGSPSDYDPHDADSWPEEKVKHTPPPNKVTTTAYGRSRSMLAMSKLEEFAAWAIADGFAREDTKGTYEVLRLRWAEKIDGRRMQPYIFFKRDRSDHVTSQAEGSQLISRWLRERNKTTT